MSLLDWSNLGATLLTFGCFSFAVTSFGGKLGRLYGFENTSGYQYISHSPNSDELFEDIVKVNANVEGTPSWAKDKEQLKKRCITYQKSLRYWNETAKYCLLQNTVRHQLIKDGFKLKEPNTDVCTNEILNNYSDGKDSLSYMVGKRKCEAPKTVATDTPSATRTETTTVAGANNPSGSETTAPTASPTIATQNQEGSTTRPAATQSAPSSPSAGILNTGSSDISASGSSPDVASNVESTSSTSNGVSS